MTLHHDHHEEPVVERRVVTQDPVSGLTGYAMVKYAFILLITIVILFFLAKYVFPMFS